MKRIRHLLVLVALIGVIGTTDASAQIRLAYIVVEGLDTLHLMPPDSESFQTRRERVAIPTADLLSARTQSGFVARRFVDSLPDIETLYSNGEMTVVNKVGFSTPQCDHQTTRELLGRGVDRPDHPQQDGWLLRAAKESGWGVGSEAWDSTEERYSLAGAGFVGYQFLDFSSANDNLRQFNGYNHRDSMLREETIYGAQKYFTANSILASSFAAQSALMTKAFGDIRTAGDEPNNYNDVFEDVFGRATYEFTNFQSTGRIFVGRIPASFGFLSGNEMYGPDTFRDQRDAYSRFMDNLQDGIREFVNDMKSAGIWDEVLLVVVPDYGRSFYATGIIDENGNDNSGDSRGTACGQAGDAFIFGDTTNILPGFYGAGYTEQEIASTPYATPNYTHTQLLDASLRAIGVNADAVIDREGRPCLTSLFPNGC